MTAGGNQAFILAATTLLDPGDEVILSTPYFVNHEMALRAIGAVPVEACVYEAAGFRTRWADIEPHITARTRAVVLCTPSNPTGAVIARRRPRADRSRAARSRHRRHVRRDVHAFRLRRCRRGRGEFAGSHRCGGCARCGRPRQRQRGCRRRLARQRRRARHVLEILWDDRMAARISARRRGSVRTGDQDPGCDDHLRPGAGADRCRRGGAEQLVLRTSLP